MSKNLLLDPGKGWTLSSYLWIAATALGENRIYRGIICEAIERKPKLI